MEREIAKFVMQERDLDLMILEQLHSDDGFDRWLALKAGLDNHVCRSARHSVSAKSNAKWGETDVLAFFSDGTESVALLIEDKIAASFTDRQAHRYRERAQDIVDNGEADRHITLLIAPASYLAGVARDDPWDCKLPIEEIRDWFGRFETAHACWRTEALTACLARIRPPTPGREDLVRFSSELSKYLSIHHAPTLNHKPNRGDASGPIIQYPGCNQNKILWWKASTGQITLQLTGPLQGHVSHLELPKGIVCEPAGAFGRKCDYLVAEVPAPDFTLPVQAQAEAVEATMAAAYRLIAFLPEIETQSAATATIG